MRVEFESGAWVELLDIGKLTAREKAVYTGATTIPMNLSQVGQTTQFNMGTVTRQEQAVMAALITGWSYEWVLPGEDVSIDEDEKLTYDASLQNVPIDDYNELAEAIEPYMDKLRGGPKARSKAGVTIITPSASSSRARRTSPGPRGSRSTP